MFVIVDYGVGNLTSIRNMLKKADVAAVISGNAEDVRSATKLLLPGMGHFDNCMKKLDESGLRPLLEQKVLAEKIPVLGICVGLQMFMESSEEGVLPGLGWIKGQTIRFREQEMGGQYKIPNMGWLEIMPTKDSALLKDLNDARFYFAHSYHVRPEDKTSELVTASYGYRFTVGIEKENMVGVQFHPEKSHRFGMRLLKNFAENY
jgi:glutamine amidotransferase